MSTDIVALVAEARDWQSRWDARRVTAGANVLIGGLLDALTTERALVAKLETEVEMQKNKVERLEDLQPDIPTIAACYKSERELTRLLEETLAAECAKVAALEAEVKIAEAKGWRDAVSCVQYCEVHWYQDCRSAEERKALENAARELVNELVTCSPGEWLGTEWKTAQDYSAAITKLEAEATRWREVAESQVRDIPEGWQPIETAPFDAAFIGIDKHWDVARCWRFAPSGRTDEVLRWKTNKPFHATHWQPISPPAPEAT